MKTKTNFIKQNIKQNEQGIAIYLVMVILALLLSVGLGLCAVLISQLKIISNLGDSVIAFYAAETGIERAQVHPAADYSASGSVGAAVYTTTGISSGGVCTPTNFCIRSIGDYKGTRRVIEIQYIYE